MGAEVATDWRASRLAAAGARPSGRLANDLRGSESKGAATVLLAPEMGNRGQQKCDVAGMAMAAVLMHRKPQRASDLIATMWRHSVAAHQGLAVPIEKATASSKKKKSSCSDNRNLLGPVSRGRVKRDLRSRSSRDPIGGCWSRG